MASETLWNYCKDEVNDPANENNANGFRKNNNKTTTIKSVEDKTVLIGRAPDNINRLDTEVAVPLKCLSDFWRSI